MEVCSSRRCGQLARRGHYSWLFCPLPVGVLSGGACWRAGSRSEEHTSELQSRENLVCGLLLEKIKRDSIIAELLRTPVAIWMGVAISGSNHPASHAEEVDDKLLGDTQDDITLFSDEITFDLLA